MQIRLLIVLALLTLSQPGAWAQGLSEFGGLQAGAAGLGAGLAASQNHGALVRNSYGAAARVQQSVEAQSRAVQQYIAQGLSFEAKKQWDHAEEAYTNALKWICNRDGPGSVAAVPALRHLARVSQAQNKLDQAIGYQKTVVAFAHRAPKGEAGTVLEDDRRLSDLYVEKGDYKNAEPILREAVGLLDTTPNVTAEEHSATLKVYGKVLRELNKTSEAEAIDASLAGSTAEKVTAP